MYLQRAGLKSARHDSMPRQAYEFKISCCKLPRRAQVIECDPVCIVQRSGTKEFAQGWQEVFQTERLQNNRSPRFERIMRINYFKAMNDRAKEPQNIRFVIADDDDAWIPAKLLTAKDAFMVLETTLEEIIDECEDAAASKGMFVRALKGVRETQRTIDYGAGQGATISIVVSKTSALVHCPPLGAEAGSWPGGGGSNTLDSEQYFGYIPRTERWLAQFKVKVLGLFKVFTSLGQTHTSTATENGRGSTLDTAEYIQVQRLFLFFTESY